MLESAIKEQLRSYFKLLKKQVLLSARLDESTFADELRAFLGEVAACSPLLTFVEGPLKEGRPHFAVSSTQNDERIIFAGLPLGHELSSFVLAVLHTGGHPPKESDECLFRARAIQGNFDVEVFISLSCHNCPEVVQALNLIAAHNPNVRVTTVDGARFVHEAEARNVLAVPAVFINGEMAAAGRQTLEDVLALLEKRSPVTPGYSGQYAQSEHLLNNKPVFDTLVVGGGPAGVAAAVYAARKGIKVGLITQRLGGQTNDTMDIENYISVVHTTGPQFAKDLKSHIQRYGVEVIEGTQVTRLVAPESDGDLATLVLPTGAQLQARSVVLAPGARWRDVGVPGEQEYRNKGVAYCPHCDGPLFKGKRVAVIGGGNSGVEAAIDLAGIASKVTVLEYGERLRADAVLVDKLKSLPNVTVHTQAETTEIIGDGHRVKALAYKNRATGAAEQVALEGIFVQIGLVPNTDFLQGVLELNRAGEIVIDAKGHTTAKGIFAAGDATTVPYKQIVVAAGEGAKAALAAFDYLVRS